MGVAEVPPADDSIGVEVAEATGVLLVGAAELVPAGVLEVIGVVLVVGWELVVSACVEDGVVSAGVDSVVDGSGSCLFPSLDPASITLNLRPTARSPTA